jgi:hypothetical protein
MLVLLKVSPAGMQEQQEEGGLNPIERVWKLTRRSCLHNRYFGQLSELIEDVENQFNQWHKGNATLKRLCAKI